MEQETIILAQKAYPVQIIIPRQERYSRLLALATLLLVVPKTILLIPHLIILYICMILGFISGFIAELVVLFTGRYPKSLFDFTSGIVRWQTRVTAYLYGLSDKYPPFRLEE